MVCKAQGNWGNHFETVEITENYNYMVSITIAFSVTCTPLMA